MRASFTFKPTANQPKMLNQVKLNQFNENTKADSSPENMCEQTFNPIDKIN